MNAQTESRETYFSVKRDLLRCEKRPTTVSKETYYTQTESREIRAHGCMQAYTDAAHTPTQRTGRQTQTPAHAATAYTQHNSAHPARRSFNSNSVECSPASTSNPASSSFDRAEASLARL